MEPITVTASPTQASKPSAYIRELNAQTDNRVSRRYQVAGLTHGGMGCIFVAETIDRRMSVWMSRLEEFKKLKDGWDSYDAPAPSVGAILTAQGFLTHLLNEPEGPSFLDASVIGGVGFTASRDNRSVYVEFYNDGTVLAVFSEEPEGVSEPPEPLIKRIQSGYQQYHDLIAEMRGYLNA